MSDPLVDVIADALWACQCDKCAPTREAQASAVATLVREYLDREKHESTVPLRPQEGSTE